MSKIIELIETEEHRGLGTQKDPCRTVYQLWSKDGVLIFERDPCKADAKHRCYIDPPCDLCRKQ